MTASHPAREDLAALAPREREREAGFWRRGSDMRRRRWMGRRRWVGRRGLGRALLAALAIVSMGRPAGATWSIVMVDRATGEVAVGSATCLPNIDLESFVPVVLVGVGAAAAQSAIDQSGNNRALIAQQMLLGTAPEQILVLLSQQDGSHQSRQYGIVDLQGRAVTFSGKQTTEYSAGRVSSLLQAHARPETLQTGSLGTIHWAIQGNILTGAPVIQAAVQAIRTTPGDLADKLLAGMQAARSMGGDGRCSCSQFKPQSCGSPPPPPFKSAHVGFMIVARIGDTDGPCGKGGCAKGSYWLNLNVAGKKKPDPDPVDQLTLMFQTWRQSWVGRPDHLRSRAVFDVPGLPEDGVSTATLTISLHDWQGTPLASGGAAVAVTHDATSDGLTTIGAVQDLGNGTYTVPITAGTAPGTDVFRVVVDDGQGPVTLHPFPRLVSGLTTLGPACPLATGDLPRMILDVPRRVGSSLGVHLAGVPRGVAAWLFAGASSTSWAGTSLPADLTPWGFPGCSLQVSGETRLPVVADGTGRARVSLWIPGNPALQGQAVRLQWIVANPPGSPANGGTSTGVRFTIP